MLIQRYIRRSLSHIHMSSAKPKFAKASYISQLLIISAFLGIFLLFSSTFILPQGSTLDRNDITDNLQRWTEGCATGGNDPKGFAYSEFPDRHRVWYEVDFSAAELECMKKKKAITMLSKPLNAGFVGNSAMGKPPEWFKPQRVIANFKLKGNAVLLTARNGQKDRYLMTRGEFD
jgi:hypothetical protein